MLNPVIALLGLAAQVRTAALAALRAQRHDPGRFEHLLRVSLVAFLPAFGALFIIFLGATAGVGAIG